MEHIKQIEDYPDYYVSDQGNVYSNKSGAMKKLKPNKRWDGYAGVCLCNNGTQKQIKIHRLVAKAFVPNPENKPCVNHKDGNRQNNCADNLEWATYKENIQYYYNVQKPNDLYDPRSEELKVRRRRYREAHLEKNESYKVNKNIGVELTQEQIMTEMWKSVVGFERTL